jgi:hypothetical protein
MAMAVLRIRDGRLSGSLFEGLAYVFHHLLGILVKHGVVLHDQEAVVVAADEEDLIALQIDVAVQGIYQHLHRGDEDVEGLFGQ